MSNSFTVRVSYECIWTAVVSLLSLAAAIDTTVTGPPVYCQSQGMMSLLVTLGAISDFDATAPYGACASSFLMVPIAWFSSTASEDVSIYSAKSTTNLIHLRSAVFLDAILDHDVAPRQVPSDLGSFRVCRTLVPSRSPTRSTSASQTTQPEAQPKLN